jgi:hypothetical protein
VTSGSAAGPVVLRSGDGCELRAGPGGLTLSRDGVTVLRSPQPVRISLFPAPDGAGELAAGYAQVQLRSNRLAGRAVLRAGRARFRIEDVFSWADPGLRLHRQVRVRLDEGAQAPPEGFASWFGWRLTADTPQWLLPGCVYGRNEHAPGYAIGAALGRPGSKQGRASVLVREDRLALPFAAGYDPAAALFISLINERPDGGTITDDDLAPVAVSDGLRFGAFGDLSAGELGYRYPGTEGTVSYPPMWTAGIGNSQADSPVNPFPEVSGPRVGTPAEAAGDPWRGAAWARRYHPVTDGFEHACRLLTVVAPAGSFPDFVRRAWRLGWDQHGPQLRRADLPAVERVSLELLAASVIHDGPPPGIPTWIDVFTGQPGRWQDTLSVGFVGRNLEVAATLMQAAARHGQPGWGQLGAAMIDSWLAVAGGSEGLCHTEWDRTRRCWVDGGQPGLVYLRDQSEARMAVLAAAAWLRSRLGGPRPGGPQQPNWPRWLDWCVAYARWLAAHVSPEGALGRSYHLDGRPADPSVNDGIHAAAFLARLAGVTGDPEHIELAERIASYYWDTFHADGVFIGGTLDNPNCYDREAATLALDAYLAVHAVTGQPRWLAAAQLAADFCETWIVGWDVPMAAADSAGPPFFDSAAWATGLGLITLGFSAVDTYLARHVGDFLRLAELTGDRHYAEVADLLLHNTKQMVQLAAEYGYTRPGYQIEHWSIGRGRGYGLNSGWLPWVATAHVIGIWAAEDDNGPAGRDANAAT